MKDHSTFIISKCLIFILIFEIYFNVLGGIPYGSITGMLQDYFGSSRGLPSQTLSGGGLGSNYVYDLGNELLGWT